MTLYTIHDILNSGYFILVLDFLSLTSIIAAVLVITTKNPIISVLFLIGLFVSVAVYLITIGIDFIGISYLLVYVGAISILFLFILMLINIRVSELLSETKNSIPLVFIVALIFANASYVVLPQKGSLQDIFSPLSSTSKLNITTHNNWENNLAQFDHINSIGNVMYSNYAIWLILASIILLLAMVGAIVITIKPKSLNFELKRLPRQS